MERIFCAMFRSFTMDFKDGAGTTFFSLKRPFHCSMVTPCCILCPQEMTLKNAHGQPAVGTAPPPHTLTVCSSSAWQGTETPCHTHAFTHTQ